MLQLGHALCVADLWRRVLHRGRVVSWRLMQISRYLYWFIVLDINVTQTCLFFKCQSSILPSPILWSLAWQLSLISGLSLSLETIFPLIPFWLVWPIRNGRSNQSLLVILSNNYRSNTCNWDNNKHWFLIAVLSNLKLVKIKMVQ